MKRLGLFGTTLLAAACSVDESSTLPTCPAGTVARGGLCSPVRNTSNLQISPERVDFGSIAIGGSTTRSFDIENTGDSTQTVRVRPPDNSAFELSVPDEEISIEANQTLAVSVTFSPDERSLVMSNIRIETCPGGCALYVALGGSGIEAQTGLRCEPLEFPQVPAGQCVYDMMICENRGAATVRITDVLVESDDGTIGLSGVRLPIIIGPGDADGIPLAFCSQQAGTSVAVVRVTTSDGVAPSVLARGTASEPDACRLSYDRNLNFGIVPSNTARQEELTLRNRGASECYLAGFVLSTGSAPPFSIDPNLERPLGPGETWTVRVHMAGSQPDTYLAELGFQVLGDEPQMASVDISAQVIDANARLDVTSTSSSPFTPLQDAAPLIWETSGDDGFSQLSLPFAFTFFGAPQDTLWVSTNGFVSFSADRASAHMNSELPSPDAPHQQISWWWDDLDPGQSQPMVAQWRVEGPRGQRVLRIQFVEVLRYGGAPNLHISAEVRLFEDDHRIEVQYGEMSISPREDQFSASVGWEGPGSLRGGDVLGCRRNCNGTDWPAFTTWTYRDAP